jgi:hypothetical protein
MNPLLKQSLQEQNAKARYISQLLAASVNTELIKQRLNASRAFNQMINQRSKSTRSKERKEK